MTVTNQLKVGKYEFMSHIHNCDQSVYKRYRTADHMCVDSIKIILIHRRPFDTQPIDDVAQQAQMSLDSVKWIGNFPLLSINRPAVVYFKVKLKEKKKAAAKKT